MKRLLVTAAAAMVMLGFSTTSANALALTIGDARYVGTINDGIPASPANEVVYINNLITLAAGAGNIVIGTETYNRIGSTTAGPFPTAVTGGSVKDETPPFGDIVVTGFTYIIGKYDAGQAGSLVWLVTGLNETVTLPTTFNGFGISHYSLYNPTTSVPDGGTTLGLLGLGMLGVGYLRRRLAQ